MLPLSEGGLPPSFSFQIFYNSATTQDKELNTKGDAESPGDRFLTAQPFKLDHVQDRGNPFFPGKNTDLLSDVRHLA